ncbi:MAG: LysM peptidoglycan-binding domain-containing protein [Pirellulales bacterium]
MNIRTYNRLNALALAACLATIGCTGGPSEEEKNALIPPGEYTVLEGDGLSHLAVRAYGDMDLWYALLNANPQLGTRPGFELIPGETITIPAKADADMSLPKSIFPKQLPADYIVMPGDSLHFIAQGCYGDRELWEKIYNANREVLSEKVKEDTRQLIAGQVLKIPAK